MNREIHVRFCEGLGVQLPWATHPIKSGQYRPYSRKIDPKTKRRRNLRTFDTREAAEKHERVVQFFKRRG
jgi:hypothetical protein